MNNFQFHRPATVADATRALAGTDDGRFLAGGQSLLPAMKMGLSAPSDLVELARIPQLKGIRVEAGALVVGAGTSHAAVAASDVVRGAIPALAHLASLIGDPAVRTAGTLGGSIALNDPAACYPAGVLGLGATIRTDRRTIAADDFFTGVYTTALEPDELIVEVSFPIPAKASWQKFKQPASRFSLVGVFVSSGPAGVRVAVTGAGPGVFRVTAFEQALARGWSASALDGLKVDASSLNTDLHATADYRAHLVGVLAKRGVTAA
ncbi:MAG: xanthine dehydrogenase family protein subunit M [Burkholderiales bacterium]|nr:xanthine dehydrogenase family protein subunit M [Burkholderiales bacterium]